MPQSARFNSTQRVYDPLSSPPLTPPHGHLPRHPRKQPRIRLIRLITLLNTIPHPRIRLNRIPQLV